MTINEVLHFSSKIDFTGKLDYKQFKKTVVNEFGNTCPSRILETLNILDDMEFYYLCIEYDVRC